MTCDVTFTIRAPRGHRDPSYSYKESAEDTVTDDGT